MTGPAIVADAYRPEWCVWPRTERKLRHGTDQVKSANRRSLKGTLRIDVSSYRIDAVGGALFLPDRTGL